MYLLTFVSFTNISNACFFLYLQVYYFYAFCLELKVQLITYILLTCTKDLESMNMRK